MSLRARVLVGGLAITVLLAVAAGVIIQVTEAHLIERVDQQLEPRAQEIEERGVEVVEEAVDGDTKVEADLGPETDAGSAPPEEDVECTESAPAGQDVECPPDPPGDDEDGPAAKAPREDLLSPFYIAQLTVDGEETLSRPALEDPAGMAPDFDDEEAMAAADSGEAFTTGSRGSDMRWRVRAVFEQDIYELPLVVAQPMADVDAAVEQLVVIEIVVTLVILAALGLVAWWVDRHGIRPVKQMTATASAIAAGDLSPRVPEAAPGTEAGQLGSALNQMLGRLEEAFDQRSRSETRLRQFVADASHELRTPVTTIRGYSELYESGGLQDSDELSEAMRRTREEAVRMGSLVDDLLLLARFDQGPVLALTQVDLGDLVRDAVRDARVVDPDRVVVTAVGEGPLEVWGDRDRLQQVLGNLVGNALVHTPSSAGVRIGVHRQGSGVTGVVVVEVADRGPGMPPEVTGRAFERFFRADPSRSRHRGGSGLGLSIVQACVEAHGGEVRLDSRPDVGTTVRVRLPVAPPPAGSLPADSQLALGQG